jgi:hypothetical protein
MYYLELLEIVFLRLIIDVKEGEFPKKKEKEFLQFFYFKTTLKRNGLNVILSM